MSPYRLNQALELAIYTWAVAASGLTVIWDKQDVYGSTFAQRPALPYVMLSITSPPKRTGYSEEIYDSLDTFKYIFRKVFTLSLELFYQSDGYLEKIEHIINTLELTTYLDKLRAGGIAVWGNEPPVDVSILLETKNEFRANVDIYMAYAPSTDVTDSPGEIQKVNIKKTNDKKFDIDIP